LDAPGLPGATRVDRANGRPDGVLAPDVKRLGREEVESMKVKNVMTKDPSCCVPSDKAPLAASIMRDENVGSVPVVESQDSRRIDPNSVAVEACMTVGVVSCTGNDSVQKATELMRENQIRRIPVVDDTGRLQGIVSMADLVGRAELKTTETHDTLEKVSAPAPAPSKPRAKSRRAA
jgi:CBS domain-containing protein